MKTLEKNTRHTAIVTDWWGSYETEARFLGGGKDCEVGECSLFVYPVADNDSTKANAKRPIGMALAGVDSLLFDDQGRIIINEKTNVSCNETSSKQERGYKGFYTPKRYIELLNKFKGNN